MHFEQHVSGQLVTSPSDVWKVAHAWDLLAVTMSGREPRNVPSESYLGRRVINYNSDGVLKHWHLSTFPSLLTMMTNPPSYLVEHPAPLPCPVLFCSENWTPPVIIQNVSMDQMSQWQLTFQNFTRILADATPSADNYDFVTRHHHSGMVKPLALPEKGDFWCEVISDQRMFDKSVSTLGWQIVSSSIVRCAKRCRIARSVPIPPDRHMTQGLARCWWQRGSGRISLGRITEG